MDKEHILEKNIAKDRKLTMRLDLCIKDKLNISRQKAREIIEQGLVTVDKKTSQSLHIMLMRMLILM